MRAAVLGPSPTEPIAQSPEGAHGEVSAALRKMIANFDSSRAAHVELPGGCAYDAAVAPERRGSTGAGERADPGGPRMAPTRQAR
ncbi:MAG TPA: hypothetical protein VGR63_08840 [Casimicrobiaceae bacterium]|jgi:hypothetical protein|nr:hypothetical protein [Casimicrobiaceae bacterium]